MEAKTNLNNTQRKMLDEVYTAHFDTIAQGILLERKRGFEALQEEVVASVTRKHSVKLNAYKKVVTDLWKLDEELRTEGMHLFRWSSDKPLEAKIHVSETYKYPKLAKYESETREIEVELSRKRKEIRARIYGMDVTYEQVEKEIMKEKIEVVLSWIQLILVVFTFIGVYAIYGAFAEDRRDVNRDGQVNLVDLSVLAVEIREANTAQ